MNYTQTTQQTFNSTKQNPFLHTDKSVSFSFLLLEMPSPNQIKQNLHLLIQNTPQSTILPLQNPAPLQRLSEPVHSDKRTFSTNCVFYSSSSIDEGECKDIGCRS